MPKTKHTEPIYCFLGNRIRQGDMIAFIPSVGARSSLITGIVTTHFDNGSGWKLRVISGSVKFHRGDNTRVHMSKEKDKGILAGAIKITKTSNPDKYEELLKLRNLLVERGKVKIEKEVEIEDTFHRDTEDNFDDLVSQFL